MFDVNEQFDLTKALVFISYEDKRCYLLSVEHGNTKGLKGG